VKRLKLFSEQNFEHADAIHFMRYFLAVSIFPRKCRQQPLGWSYCAASLKLGRNEVKTKDKP